MAKMKLGFDIGSNSLKAAVLTGGKVRVEELRLPMNMVDENESITHPHAFVRFLKEAKSSLSLPKGPAALALPPGKSICRYVTMPPMTEAQLKLNIPFEFSDFIQDATDQYICDYAVCQPDSNEETEGIPMMAAVASKQTLGAYADMFAQAGFKLRVMVPQEMALVQLCNSRNTGVSEHCFIDLGHLQTRIIVIRQDRVQAVREIPLGGHNIDNAIAAELGVDQYLADTYKMTDYQGVLGLPAVSEICEQIAVEVLKVINFYRFTYRDGDLNGVYLIGGGASLDIMRRAIAAAIEMPLLDPATLLPGAGERAAVGVIAAGAAMGGE